MNLNNINSVFIGIFLFCYCSYSYSQVNTRETLEHYTDPSLIKNNNIKSLVVFAEMNERDIREYMSESGKTVEMEFNTAGYWTYKITSDNHGNNPVIYYGRGSLIEINTYDQNNRLNSHYIENYLQSRKEIKEYNSDGNLSSLQYIVGNDTVYKIVFEWRGNRMIKSAIVNADTLNSDRRNQYDDQGRITQSKSKWGSVNYQYEQKNDTLMTTATFYKSDTLFFTEIYKTILKFNRIISYERRDHAEKLVIEMNATLDKNGNATYYYLNDAKNYSPFSYNIQNFYDYRNLLIKRMFYFSREDYGSNLLTKIERYFFDDDTLTFKMREGYMLEREEQSESGACEGGACDASDE